MLLLRLVAVFLIGLTAALAVFLFYRIRGKPTPRFMLTLAAGGAMLTFLIYDEYSWVRRVTAQLPASVEVVQRYETRSLLSPWTYLVPRVERLTAVDTQALRRNPQLPDHVLFDLLLVQRMSPTRAVPQIVDCKERRRAFLGADQRFGPDGMPDGVSWEELPAGDPLLRTVCAG